MVQPTHAQGRGPGAHTSVLHIVGLLGLQTTARRNGIPIDTLAFEYSVINLEEREINSAPKEGVYVKGMFLEGEAYTSAQLWTNCKHVSSCIHSSPPATLHCVCAGPLDSKHSQALKPNLLPAAAIVQRFPFKSPWLLCSYSHLDLPLCCCCLASLLLLSAARWWLGL